MATTGKKVTAEDLLNRVLLLLAKGKYNDHLDRISSAVNAQRAAVHEQQARENLARFTVGSRVRIISSVRPKYLGGLAGEVVPRPPTDFKQNPGVLYVKLDVGKVRTFGPVVGVPAGSLEEE